MKKRNGFTLVELLAVIVILAIIMLIAIPNVLNTLTSARQKTFGEFVTKVYYKAQEKRLADGYLGTSKDRYDITTDLGMGSTGDFKGYVLFVKNSKNEEEVYIGITNGEYNTATQYGEDETSRVNYINYTHGGEPKYSDSLSQYTGTSNSFIRGNVETISMPESQSSPDFVELKPSMPPQEDYETKLKLFYNKAYNQFKTDLSNNSVSRLDLTCKDNHDHGYTLDKTYDYNQMTGDTSENNKGFISFVFFHYIDDSTVTFDSYFAIIAFRDKNYHTITEMRFPLDNTLTNFGSQMTPFSLEAAVNEEMPFKAQLTNTPPVYNQVNLGLQIVEALNTYTTKEDFSNKIKNAFDNNFLGVMYVPNSNNDGMTKELYNKDFVYKAANMKPTDLVTQITAGLGIYPR